MAYDNESRERGSAGALIVAAVAGIVLGGALAFGAGAMADSTTLPSDEQIAVSGFSFGNNRVDGRGEDDRLFLFVENTQLW